MKAIIFAQESGYKLRQLTSKKPKCMVKVAGKPILDYQIKAFKSAGIKEIIIIIGYKNEKVRNFCKDIKDINIKLIYNADYENTNNIYSLYLAKDYLIGKSFISVNSDIVFDSSILYKMTQRQFKDTIACDNSRITKDSMKIIMNSSNFIHKIIKTISSREMYATSIDICKFSEKSSLVLFKEIFKIIKLYKNLNCSIEKVLNKLFKRDELKMKPFYIEGKSWVKINNYDDLANADKSFSIFDITFKNKEIIFLDLDGTVYKGNNLISGAKQFLEYLNCKGIIYYFLSNNSSRSKIDYVKKLLDLGIQTTEERIILSTDGVIEFLLKEKVKNVYIVGTESMKEMFIKSGFTVDSQSPEFVILGYDTELTYEKIRTASIFIQNGVKLIATHCDNVCPTQEGLIPDIGSMLALFEKATKKKPVMIFGKPNTEMISYVINRHKVSPKELAIIGDRIYTDMELARRIGCDFVCVLSGETQRENIEEIDIQPALVVKDIGNIL